MKQSYRGHELEITYQDKHRHQVYHIEVSVDGLYSFNTKQFVMPNELKYLPWSGDEVLPVVIDATDFPFLTIYWKYTRLRDRVDLQRLLQMIDQIDNLPKDKGYDEPTE